MGKEPLFYEPADKILFLVPKKQVFGWWSDVYLVVDQSKFVELIRQIISEQSDEVDISKKTRLGSLIQILSTIFYSSGTSIFMSDNLRLTLLELIL